MQPFKLIVKHVEGAQRVQVYTFEAGPVLIGRDRSCQVQLKDRHAAVSRRHAEVQQGAKGYVLVDLGSKNATIHGQRPLTPGQPAPLQHGDRFRVGDFEVTFSQEAELPGGRPDALDAFSREASLLLDTAYGQVQGGGDASALTATLRQANKELRLLSELAFAIGAARGLDEIIDTLVRRSVQITGAEQGEITLLSDTRQNAASTLIRVVREDEAAPRLGEQLIAWIQRTQQPVRVDRERTPRNTMEALGASALQSLLSVPLVSRGTLIGVLTLYNKQEARGFTRDDERLMVILAAQSAQMIVNARLRKQEARLLRVREELRVAQSIQAQLMPAAAPHIEGYEIAGRSQPAQEVGGDFFDVIELNPERIGLYVGDVAGKGLPAALVMASSLAMLRSLAGVLSSPADLVARINTLLHERTDRRTFVTLFYAELDRTSGQLGYVNAGHCPAVLRRAGGSVHTLRPTGPGLGLMPGAAYAERHVDVAPGDCLLIYSDGITEAMNEAREEFGAQRAESVLLRETGEAAQGVMNALFAAVARHRGAARQHDDMTLIVVRRSSAGAHAREDPAE